MSRELRLAFAMGGGVSLGTFSGAALSEAVKLALLYGKYHENGSWQRYDSVVVDVFSGASAGAMSLACMLRTLVHRTEEQEREAEENLRRILKTAYDVDFDALNLSAKDCKAAIAAQAVQDMQEKVWIDEINIHRLLGRRPDGTRRDIRHEGGILDRGAVEEITRKAIAFSDGVSLDGKILLGDRVLFGCTLANLSPTVYDAKADIGTLKKAGFAGLTDALTSRAHRDIRIYDLNFGEVDSEATESKSRYPERWCRYHEGAERKGEIGDLRLEKTWGKIAATAIAAGAFPFAFSPVVLKRDKFEFGNLWPEEFGPKGQNYDEYPFTYVDGGLFNNEPIREAFRLSAVLDAQRRQDSASGQMDYDRRIIFVDPLVGRQAVSFQVPIHQQYDYQDPNFFGALDGTDLYQRSTFDRLKSHAGTVVSALLNQARIVEGDKVYQVRKQFEIRDGIRAFVSDVLTEAPAHEQLTALQGFCEEILDRDTKNLVIPAGTLTLSEELERVLAEEASSGLDALQAQAEDFLAKLEKGDPLEDADEWLRAMVFVAIDLVMNLEGKRPSSRVIAVSPVKVVEQNGSDADESENGERAVKAVPYHLPGARLMGFGGFTSKEANRYTVRLARYCTWHFLNLCDLTPDAPAPTEPRWTPSQKAQYQKDFEIGLEALTKRLEATVEESHFLNYSFFNSPLAALAARFIRKAMEEFRHPELPRRTYEFRIKVPGKDFEIDGRPDQRPVHIGCKPHLVVYAEYGPHSEDDPKLEWSGPFIDQTNQSIKIDREGLLDRSFCELLLPSDDLIEKASLLPDPIFYIEVKKEHEGDCILPNDWRVFPTPPSITPLGDSLLGTDSGGGECI